MQVVGVGRGVVSSFWESQARRVKQNSHVKKHLPFVFTLCSQLDMLPREKMMEANLIRCIPGQMCSREGWPISQEGQREQDLFFVKIAE